MRRSLSFALLAACSAAGLLAAALLVGTPSAGAQEGTTTGVDRSADAAVVRPWADAGVTWWLEADWYVPADEVADYARDRLRAGPPPL